MSDYFERVNNGSIRINIMDEELHDGGAKEIARALIHPNTRVKGLSLCCRAIQLYGIRALAQALEINTTLQRLSLFDNQVGPEGDMVLLKALERKIDTSVSTH